MEITAEDYNAIVERLEWLTRCVKAQQEQLTVHGQMLELHLSMITTLGNMAKRNEALKAQFVKNVDKTLFKLDKARLDLGDTKPSMKVIK